VKPCPQAPRTGRNVISESPAKTSKLKADNEPWKVQPQERILCQCLLRVNRYRSGLSARRPLSPR